MERVNTFKYLGLHFHVSYVYIPPHHPSECKGSRALICGASKTISAAVWQHIEPQNVLVAKHPDTLSTLRVVNCACTAPVVQQGLLLRLSKKRSLSIYVPMMAPFH